MILITTKNFDEAGYIEFQEDTGKTRYPEVKRNINAYPTLDNDIIIEDRGMSYLDSIIEVYSKDSITLEQYTELRKFFEKNAVFYISLITGTYEVYKAALNVEGGLAKITAQVSKLVD